MVMDEMRSIRANCIISKGEELFFVDKIPDRDRKKFPRIVYVPELSYQSDTKIGNKLKVFAYSYIDDDRVLILNGKMDILNTTWENIIFDNGIPRLQQK